MNDADIIANLPGDLKHIASLLGVDAALILVEHCGGSYLIVPKCEGLIREIRDKKIRGMYDTGDITIRELAWKFKLSDRQIQNILSRTDKNVPSQLLDLFGNTTP